MNGLRLVRFKSSLDITDFTGDNGQAFSLKDIELDGVVTRDKSNVITIVNCSPYWIQMSYVTILSDIENEVSSTNATTHGSSIVSILGAKPQNMVINF
jgi:hypothetical protein